MKTRLLLTLAMTLFYGLGFTQECGTHPTPEQIMYMDQTSVERENYYVDHHSRAGETMVPIQIHIVRRTNGTGGLSATQITSLIDDMNVYYANANMAFFQCSAINYINNNSYFDFNASNENAIGSANDVTNVINIYFFNSVTSGTSALCGYTRFPPSSDRIIMANDCATNGSTMTHEMGHYFSLYHTHGKTNTGTTDELVNGTNCSVLGDNVCDTPADPNLSGLVSSSCAYTGNATDANGDTFVPNPRNVMSYARKSCRTEITTGQYNRIAFSLANDRNYLTCGSTPTGPSYCASKGTNPIDTEIDKVTFNTISQSSTSNCSGYSDYTGVSTSVVVGESYALSIETGDCDGGSVYNRGIAAYIDWNIDGDFSDTGERVLLQANGNTYDVNVNVNVPAGATIGATRMRIVATEGGVTGACGNYTYGETEDYTVNITGGSSAPVSYCTSNASNSIDTEIDNVSFGGINKSSGGNCTGYTDFTGTFGTVTRGQAYTLSISTGDCDGGSSYNRGIAAYIDWNIDGDFTDAGERVLLQANGGTFNASSTVNVPSGASAGVTRMRVITTEGGVTGSCGTYTYGETEDYSLNVGGSSDEITNNSLVENTISVYPNPTNGQVRLEIALVDEHALSYELYDVVGKLIERTNTRAQGNYSSILDLSGLENGIYLLRVNIDGQSTLRKVILEK